MESTLRNQIIEAIDNDYLEPLRNTTTDMIDFSIPRVFEFLRANYGRLTCEQLKDREKSLDDLVYSPADNVDTIFNKIQHLQDVCSLLNKDETDTQLVDYGYLIFQKSGIFQDSLRKWNNKPDADQTFRNFKTFMRKEYLDLQDVGGLTVQTSSLNLVKELKEHQEMLSQDLRNEIRSNIYETFQTLNMNEENINPNVEYNPSSFQPFECPQVQDVNQMFAAKQNSGNTIILQLLTKLNEMESKISSLSSQQQFQSRQQ